MRIHILSATALALLRLSRKLWLRVTLFALLAVLASILAIVLEDRIPSGLKDRFTPESIMPILTILASGMLAVSTFSLNVMVAAHGAAAGQTTPRVHAILLADTTTHTVLATFIGAFVYALSAIILFQTGFYPDTASVLVLGFTVAVVVLVVLALLRWIHHLSDLGSLDATLLAIEQAARGSLIHDRSLPALGAQRLSDDTVLPTDARPLTAPETGYLQLIDMQAISKRLTTDQTRIYLHVRPGDYLVLGQTIGHATGLAEAEENAICRNLTIAATRSCEQDAGYGLLLLSETASRALSPGVNDPGTAIAVLCRQEKLLLDWAHARPDAAPPRFPRLFLPEISRAAMIENAFAGAARDGAGQIEVALRLQDALTRLAATPDPALAGAARDMAIYARQQAETFLPLERDKVRLRAAYLSVSP